MKLRMEWSRTVRNAAVCLPAFLVICGWIGGEAQAEQRKFAVMPAHSPKSFAPGGVPGLPPGGLGNIETIRKDYFDTNDPSIDSFAEYWDEISYGDVIVTGRVFGWVTLPWAFDPNPPTGLPRPSPQDFIDLRTGNTTSEGSTISVPQPYAYGAGEDFCDTPSSLDSQPQLSTDKCGALILTDLGGRPDGLFGGPRAEGLSDVAVSGINVWTPGERFIDIDSDNRWDGLDERNDRMCHGQSGCRDICAPSVCAITGNFCTQSSDCPGQTCVVATGTCSSTGAYCVSNAQCGAGLCQGFCQFSGIRCVNRDDCSNPLEACLGVASDQPCGGINNGGINNIACQFSGETCGDPFGSGPRGCNFPGCGDLATAWVDRDGNGRATNPAGDLTSTESGCTIPQRIACMGDGDCLDLDDITPGRCVPSFPFGGVCLSTNCISAVPNLALPPCCEGSDDEKGPCMDNGGVDIDTATQGITCGEPIFCCEYVDADFSTAGPPGDGQLDVPEAFEDFMIRWNPAGRTPGTVWARVDEKYVRDNYPGDVEGLIRRTGNGYYNPPDMFFDRGNAKMMQDAGANATIWATPKPGKMKEVNPGISPSSGYATEEPWFDQFWTDRYDSAPPVWPAEQTPLVRNSPRMRLFDVNNTVPPAAEPTNGRRWFKPNRGAGTGFGSHPNNANHWAPTSPFVDLELGSENVLWPILPEETLGYYDGWVEHDDLPSSKYHSEGDKRLGEITSPTTDTVTRDDEVYTTIFGADLGANDPNAPFAPPDGLGVAAGPYAVNIHGEKGFDAGDTCIVEWLTWRTDGANSTVAYQWELDNGTYHPFAGPSSPLTGGPVGFRDYNLDGMIDQGEVRPERSENYSTDSNPNTANDGTFSDYPFNRRRLLEDVVEALDASIDWDEFIDVNARDAALCSHDPSIAYSADTTVVDPEFLSSAQASQYIKTIPAQGFVSGVVLVPPGSYNNLNQFPTAPGFYPIHNEDNDDSAFMFPDWQAAAFDADEVHKSFNLKFHDLVVCQNCREFSSAKAYSAHEYGHAWENFPDLYDRDRLALSTADDENCPVGVWDIMADFSLVHPNPVLKEQACTAWTEPVDLTTILTPAVETTITLPSAEFVRDESYFYLENEDLRIPGQPRTRERYYLWSAGNADSFDVRLPDEGMLILHVNDIFANPESVALQQRTFPFNFTIVQADGRGDLEACSSDGNTGDSGDMWPGATDATNFNFDTIPAAKWNALNRWTGLDISNVEPDGNGSVAVTMTWVPTSIPSARFLTPPGGESVGSTYQVRFEVSDVFGGTTARIFYTPDEKTCGGGGSGKICDKNSECAASEQCLHDTTIEPAGSNFIDALSKTTTGTQSLSVDWELASIPDGRYVVFAKLDPGPGVDGTESKYTAPRAGRTNKGDGTLEISNVDINNDGVDTDDTARLETWTVECIDAAGTKWRVNSNLTQPVLNEAEANAEYANASTGTAHTSVGGEVTFTIRAGSVVFALGDTFSFTTTGITAVSRAVTVVDHRVSEGPIAVARASLLSGKPPLLVSFDGLDSRDPNGEQLDFLWDFGDGTEASGAAISHTYTQPGTFTAVLRVANLANGRFGEDAVDITVINNSPNAEVSADKIDGLPPLTVRFDASGSGDGTETPPENLIYQWDFGDGQGANDQGSSGLLFQQVEHIYRTDKDGKDCSASVPCEFIVTLTVTDEGGKKDTDNIKIRVGNTTPVAQVSASPKEGPAPLTVRFNAKGSTDADKHALTVDWDFGDGVKRNDVAVAGDDGNGAVEHIYTTKGEYIPKATVKDGFPGGEDEWIGETIVVTEPVEESSAPRALFSVVPSTLEVELGNSVRVDASASSDPDGGALTYQWEWNDGTANGSGKTAEHTYAIAGSFRIRLTVTDLESKTGTTFKTVVVLDEGEVPEEGSSPTASFTVDRNEGFANATVFRFDASASDDPDGDVLTYRWDFGDGTVLNDADIVVTHRYVRAGAFVVRLSVRDETNREAGATRDINVLANVGNRSPVAVIGTGVRSGPAPLTITFDGRNSFDPNDGDVITYLWQFKRSDGSLLSSQEGAIVTQTFDDEGNYTVELEVTDDCEVQGVDCSLRGVAGPETIEVTAPFTQTDPGSGQTNPGEEGGTTQPTGGGICGLGMMMGLFSSLLGLSLIRLGRGRRKRNR